MHRTSNIKEGAILIFQKIKHALRLAPASNITPEGVDGAIQIGMAVGSAGLATGTAVYVGTETQKHNEELAAKNRVLQEKLANKQLASQEKLVHEQLISEEKRVAAELSAKNFEIVIKGQQEQIDNYNRLIKEGWGNQRGKLIAQQMK